MRLDANLGAERSETFLLTTLKSNTNRQAWAANARPSRFRAENPRTRNSQGSTPKLRELPNRGYRWPPRSPNGASAGILGRLTWGWENTAKTLAVLLDRKESGRPPS